MAKILIKNALVVVTQDSELGEIAGGDVLVDGRVIAAVGCGVGEQLKAEPDLIIDAAGMVVIPGLVNTHHHLFQVLTRNMASVQDAKLFDWLTYLYQLWQAITEDDVEAAATAGLGELLLTGCTTCADHQYLIPACDQGDFFAAEVRAAKAVGVRICLMRGSMSKGKSAGGLPPDSLVQDEETILSDSLRIIESYHDDAPCSMCQVALAPCSPFSVGTELMRSTAELARSKNVRLHTHLAETKDEEAYCLQQVGLRPVDLMDELGWLAPDVWFAHCVHLKDEEIDRLAKSGTGVAHCPVSNLRLGSGIAPVPQMLSAGISVGLSVDGSSSNDSSNMLRELQVALLVHRVGSCVNAMPARKVLHMATRGGARVLGRDDIGVLAPGKAADLAIFDLRGLAYAGALHDPVSALMFCGIDQRAEWVLVNGEVVVQDRRLVQVDQDEICRSANQASRRLIGAAPVS